MKTNDLNNGRNMEKKEYLKLNEVASRLKISTHTIYRNPRKYHMFKVGNLWRADEQSLEKFSTAHNNVVRLAVVGKESKQCRSSKEGENIGWTSQPQTERELGVLLAPRKKPRQKSTTTS